MLKWEYGIDDNGKDESAPVKSQISKDDYAQWPSLGVYMKNNGLQSRIKSQSRATAVVDVFKEYSDWLVSYHFKTKAGCWFLWQYEDQSL